MMVLVVAWCILLHLVMVGSLSTWNYGGGPAGPASWGGQCTSGQEQSPVNLVSNNSQPIERWTFSNSYRYKVPCTITNDGNSLRFSFNTSKPTTISGAELNGDYVMSHGTFHWGGEDTEGSEHLVKGERYPLEIQIVHYNSKYGSYKEAEGKEDGLAVVSTLYKLADRDNTKLSPIIDSLDQITNPGTSFLVVKEIPANSFYPTIRSPLYRYTGSLTTPPCTEKVTWTVFYNTNTVSSSQLAKLRSLQSSEGKSLGSTFRQPAQLHSRTVLIGAAWMARKDTIKPTTETIKTMETQKEFLQMAVKTEDVAWYSKPAPMWTVVVGGVMVVVGGGLLAFLIVKKRLGTHAMVPTDDIEMD